MKRRSLAAAVGVIADRLVGEPPAGVHPLVGFGRVMASVETAVWRDARRPGVAYTAAGIGLGAGVGGLAGTTVGATTLAVGGRALGRAATAVGDALARGDLEGARSLLPSLVGRDPSGLDEKEMARAVVESVAENTVDAVVAPAVWAAIAGAAGALGYRAANTLDALVGHHSARHERFGWASASVDDLAGWGPARVTAALVAAVRPRSAAAVWEAVRHDAPAHPSPNAGVAEAAFAGALGLRLGGVNCYDGRLEVRPSLGTGRPPEAADIERAVHLASDVGLTLAAGLALAPLLFRRRAASSKPGRRGR